MNAGIKVWHKAWLYSIMTSSRARPHISALLIDLSGTLHIDKMPTKNSKEALQKLRLANIPFRFCSNTSKESTESLYHRLSAMGFNPDMDSKREIWTSLGALKSRLKVDGLTRFARINPNIHTLKPTLQDQAILLTIRVCHVRVL